MVKLTNICSFAKKFYKDKALRRYLRSGFLDKVQIKVKAGAGGSGMPKYGGIGGNGGDVYIIAKEDVTLSNVAKRAEKIKEFVAGSGYDSTKKGIIGQGGEDLEISVPTGVLAYNRKGELLGEVDQPGKKLIIAEGGVGGCEETQYGGLKGQNHSVILDLKLISDVALVGFPNAGKSTLITQISRSRPRIAAYPFTTVKPQLGVIEYPDLRKITITDLPGLIEGAHRNVGMGHDFLKHLERSKMLVFVVDIMGFQLSYKWQARNCLETILLLNKEIELYKPEILETPALLVVNKMDLDGAKEKFKEVEPLLNNLENFQANFPIELCPTKLLKFEDVLPMSLKNKNEQELLQLKTKIRDIIDKMSEMEQLKIDDEMPEYKLIKKLKREHKHYAPLLV